MKTKLISGLNVFTLKDVRYSWMLCSDLNGMFMYDLALIQI